MQPDRNTKIQEHITKHKNTIIDNKFTEELATRILLLQSSKKWDESSTKNSKLQKTTYTVKSQFDSFEEF